MDQPQFTPQGEGQTEEGKPTKRSRKMSGWSRSFLVIIVISLIVGVLNGINAYFFPCPVDGAIRGSFPCDVSDAARWVAAFREGIKYGFGTMCCPSAILAVAYVCTAIYKAYKKEEAKDAQQSAEGSVPEPTPKQPE